MKKIILGAVFAVQVGILMVWNISPEKSSYHTSTVPGTSGDLICNSSCKVKEQ